MNKNCKMPINSIVLHTICESELIATLSCTEYHASTAKISINGSHDDLPIAPLVVFFRKSSLAEGNASNLFMKFIILRSLSPPSDLIGVVMIFMLMKYLNIVQQEERGESHDKTSLRR